MYKVEQPYYDDNGYGFETGKIYRHFKGKFYYVHSLAEHTETGETMVVYQALYDDGIMYTRPYKMFTNKVDKEKYPNADQEYRFMPCVL